MFNPFDNKDNLTPTPSSFLDGSAFNLPEVAPSQSVTPLPMSSKDNVQLPMSSKDNVQEDAFRLPEIKPLVDPFSMQGARQILGTQPMSIELPTQKADTPSPVSYQSVKNTIANDKGYSSYTPSPFNYPATKKRLSVPTTPTMSSYKAPPARVYSARPYNQETAENRESYDYMLAEGLISSNVSFSDYNDVVNEFMSGVEVIPRDERFIGQTISGRDAKQDEATEKGRELATNESDRLLKLIKENEEWNSRGHSFKEDFERTKQLKENYPIFASHPEYSKSGGVGHTDPWQAYLEDELKMSQNRLAKLNSEETKTDKTYGLVKNIYDSTLGKATPVINPMLDWVTDKFLAASRIVTPKELEYLTNLTERPDNYSSPEIIEKLSNSKNPIIRMFVGATKEVNKLATSYANSKDKIGFSKVLTEQVTANFVKMTAQREDMPSVTRRTQGDTLIREANNSLDKLRETDPEAANTIQNISYSFAIMAPSAITGAVTLAFTKNKKASQFVAGVVSGATGYGLSKNEITQQFVDWKNKESIEKTGVGLSVEQERELLADFEPLAKEYAIWEAGPEALSGFVGFGLLSGLSKNAGWAFLVTLIEELTTETVTEFGQQNILHKAGFPDSKKLDWTSLGDIVDTMVEIFPSVFTLTSLTGGTGGAISNLQQRRNTNKVTKDLIASHGSKAEMTDAINSRLELLNEKEKGNEAFGLKPMALNETENNEREILTSVLNKDLDKEWKKSGKKEIITLPENATGEKGAQFQEVELPKFKKDTDKQKTEDKGLKGEVLYRGTPPIKKPKSGLIYTAGIPEVGGGITNVLGDAAYLSKDKNIANKFAGEEGDVSKYTPNLGNKLVLNNDTDFFNLKIEIFKKDGKFPDPLDPMIHFGGEKGAVAKAANELQGAIKNLGYDSVEVNIGSNNNSNLIKYFQDSQTILFDESQLSPKVTLPKPSLKPAKVVLPTVRLKSETKKEIAKRFQKEGKSFEDFKKEINKPIKENIAKEKEGVEKALKTTVFTDQESFDKNLEGTKESLKDNNDLIYGYAKNGKIYINPKTISKDVLFHEASHLWLKALKDQNKSAYNNIKSVIKNSDFFEKAKRERSDLKSDEAITDEALALAMEQFKNNPQTLSQKVRKAINDFVNAVLDILGITNPALKSNAYAVLNGNIEDLVNMIGQEITGVNSVTVNTAYGHYLTEIKEATSDGGIKAIGLPTLKLGKFELSKKGEKIGFTNKWDELVFFRYENLKKEAKGNLNNFKALLKKEVNNLISDGKNGKFVLEKLSSRVLQQEKQIAEDRGMAEVAEQYQQILDGDKSLEKQTFEEIKNSQQNSINAWVNYFENNNDYSDGFKYYVLKNLKDKVKIGLKVKSRVADTMTDFIPRNSAALANWYADGSTNSLYEEYLDLVQVETLKINESKKIRSGKVSGSWVKFNKGSDGAILAGAVNGTPWCTCNTGTAQGQLNNGDFYVFFTEDNNKKHTIPRIAIRMNGVDEIGEIRGVADSDQNIEGSMTKIAKDKYSGFSNAKKYEKQDSDMKRLTDINKKEKLDKADLRFLYEIDGGIKGFGYSKDPRIQKLLSGRDLRTDLSIITGFSQDQISIDDSEFFENKDKIKYHNGNLNLRDTEIKTLPEGLTVSGRLNLEGSQIETLPEGINVGDSLHLAGSQVETLPEGLNVSGNLNLSNSQIKTLPEGLTVGGSLDLTDSQIKTLPEGLNVSDSLYLRNTEIKTLPEGLTVGSSIGLSNSKIETLPEGLTVSGYLYLEDSKIKTLPEGLTVGGSLDLQNTEIKTLPEGLTVGDRLDLSGSKIKTLPEGLTVGGSLDLRNTSIKTLPEGLTVGYSLYLQNTEIKTLPKNITVEGTIFKSDSTQDNPQFKKESSEKEAREIWNNAKKEKTEITLPNAEKKKSEAIKPGHEKFNAFVDTMVTNKTITQEEGPVLKALFEDTNDDYLGVLNFSENPRFSRTLGQFNVTIGSVTGVKPKSNKLQMQKGLSLLKDSDETASQILVHEYGHAGWYLILNDKDRADVEEIYNSMSKSEQRDVFLGDNYKYYASSSHEFWAQSFSDYVFENKISSKKMEPLLKRIAKRLFDALKKLVRRENIAAIETMSHLYEKILAGDSSTALSPLANLEPKSFKKELQKLFDKIDNKTNDKAKTKIELPKSEQPKKITLPKPSPKPAKVVLPSAQVGKEAKVVPPKKEATTTYHEAETDVTIYRVNENNEIETKTVKGKVLDNYTKQGTWSTKKPKTVAAKKILGIKLSPIKTIRKREATIIKDRIKAIQKEARQKQWSKEKLAREIAKLKEKTIEAVRAAELKGLKQTIIKGVRELARGKREGGKAARDAIVNVQSYIENYLKALGLNKEERSAFSALSRNLAKKKDPVGALRKVFPIMDEKARAFKLKQIRNNILLATKKELEKHKLKKDKMGKTTVEYELLRNAYKTVFFADKYSADKGEFRSSRELEKKLKDYEELIGDNDSEKARDTSDSVILELLRSLPKDHNGRIKGFNEMSNQELQGILETISGERKIARKTYLNRAIMKAAKTQDALDQFDFATDNARVEESDIDKGIIKEITKNVGKDITQKWEDKDFEDRGFAQIINHFNAFKGIGRLIETFKRPIERADNVYLPMKARDEDANIAEIQRVWNFKDGEGLGFLLKNFNTANLKNFAKKEIKAMKNNAKDFVKNKIPGMKDVLAEQANKQYTISNTGVPGQIMDAEGVLHKGLKYTQDSLTHAYVYSQIPEIRAEITGTEERDGVGIWWENKQGKNGRVVYFDDSVWNALESVMNNEAKQIAAYALKVWNNLERAEQLAIASEIRNNKPMNLQDLYAPRLRKYNTKTKDDASSDAKNVYGIGTRQPGWTKERVKNDNPYRVVNIWEAILPWQESTNRYIAYENTMNNIRNIITNPKLRQIVEARFGKIAYRELMDSFQWTSTGGVGEIGKTWVDKMFEDITSRLSVMYVGGKVRNLLTQSTSSIIALAEMPLTDFVKAVAYTQTHRKKAISKLKESPTIEFRHKKTGFSKGMFLTEKERSLSPHASIAETMMYITKIGDMEGVMGAGYPLYLHYLREHTNAIKGQRPKLDSKIVAIAADGLALADAVSMVSDTQQSPLPQYANKLRRAKGATRSLSAFQQSMSMYRAMASDSITRWQHSKNKYSRKALQQVLKEQLVYRGLTTAFYEFSKGNFNPYNIAVKVLISPISGFTGWGQGASFAILSVTYLATLVSVIKGLGEEDEDELREVLEKILPYQYQFLINEAPKLINSAFDSAVRLLDDETGESVVNEWMDIAALVGFMSNVPAKNLKNEYTKTRDILNGDSVIRLLESEWQAKRRKDEEPKKGAWSR